MLEIRLLGEQRVTASDEPLEVLGSPRILGLLGYLVVHAGAPQLRQQVAGVFWPESTEAQARSNLRRELTHLRAGLPDPDRFLAVDARLVRWREDAPGWVDVVEFAAAASEATAAAGRGDEVGFVAAAQRAVEAYGGVFLPGLYDDWVLAERERLHRECVGLLDRLASVLAEQGEVETAVGYARRRVELEPLEESGYRALMSLQARAGDRAAALRTFHRCVSVLERELGVEPSPGTAAVYAGLFARAPSPVPAAAAPGQVGLVGRDAELGALQTAWAKVVEGPGLVVVAGEAGVGKTRVVAEFAEAVEHAGGAVARARCFASRGRLPLGPVAEWLRSPTLRQSIEQLEGVWRAEVGRLVPELAGGDGPAQPAPLTDAWQRRQFFEGLARAVLAAGAPTLLVLDDLQWADTETLAWVELLLQLELDAPLLVVATLRSEEPGDHAELVEWHRRLRAAGLLRELELAPLSVEEAGELAATLGGTPLDEAARRRLQAETGGFPLFIVESLREDSSGSARAEAVLAGRFAPLGSAAGELVGLAAAVGRDFSLELLAAADILDDEELIRTVDELWRRRLLREHSAATYDFAHDLLREAAYARLTPPHQRRAHRRIAAALEALHADDLDAVAAQIAEQCERGGQPERAIGYHTMAAEAAGRMFAVADAVRHYERALELLAALPAGPARDRRELELRQALAPPLTVLRGFAAPELGDVLERTAELGERLGEPAVVRRIHGNLVGNLFVQGRIHEAAALADRLAAGALEDPGETGALLDRQASAVPLFSLGRLSEALAHFQALDEQVQALDEEAQATETASLSYRTGVLERGMQAHAHWLAGQADEAAASATVALERAEGTANPFDATIARAYAAVTAHLLGDAERTAELAASVRGLCEQHEIAYYGEWARILEGRLAGASGAAEIRHSIDRLRRAQHPQAVLVGPARRGPHRRGAYRGCHPGAGRGAHVG